MKRCMQVDKDFFNMHALREGVQEMFQGWMSKSGQSVVITSQPCAPCACYSYVCSEVDSRTAEQRVFWTPKKAAIKM
jgi:hypothetical protein